MDTELDDLPEMSFDDASSCKSSRSPTVISLEFSLN